MVPETAGLTFCPMCHFLATFIPFYTEERHLSVRVGKPWTPVGWFPDLLCFLFFLGGGVLIETRNVVVAAGNWRSTHRNQRFPVGFFGVNKGEASSGLRPASVG